MCWVYAKMNKTYTLSLGVNSLMEKGNVTNNYDQHNPNDVKKAQGLFLHLFLPVLLMQVQGALE